MRDNAQDTPQIIDVWSHNLSNAMKHLSEQIENYSFISIDTKFPGVLAKPIGNFTNVFIREYQKLKVNVDLLNIIQLGLTLADKNGNIPEICTFQFNFLYDLEKEMYNSDSIELLRYSEIDFAKHKEEGIPPEELAFHLTQSGLIFETSITWISFHSSYDFAYMLKILTFQAMPTDESEFYKLLNMNFINIYDLKYLLRNTMYVKRGLQDISNEMGLKRFGVQHQAGSDSMLTSDLFFYIKKYLLKENEGVDCDDSLGSESIEHCKGKLFGLENCDQ